MHEDLYLALTEVHEQLGTVIKYLFKFMTDVICVEDEWYHSWRLLKLTFRSTQLLREWRACQPKPEGRFAKYSSKIIKLRKDVVSYFKETRRIRYTLRGKRQEFRNPRTLESFGF